MEISPYLSAIQTLKGRTPGEKYRSLHSIAIQIIQNEAEKKSFLESGFTSFVQSPLLPFLRIIVGNKLMIKEFVIEALKSNDVAIVEQALNAKWFFNVNNEYIRVDYFLDKIMPFVTLRTRRRLVKNLARCLTNHTQKADDFFTVFVDLYGLNQTLPLLSSCSEQFILATVFKRRVQLSDKILRTLYLRCPQLVIRYLQLGNDKNEKNLEDRHIYKINITKYLKVLPMIVKYYPEDFVEIYKSVSMYYYTNEIKIGSTRAKYVLKNSPDLMIQNAELVFKSMPIKIIHSVLSAQQFEIVFGNLFPKDLDELSVYDIIYHLRCYPEEKKFSLIREKYKLAYDKDILDNPTIYRTTEFFRILPVDVKEDFGRRVLELHRDTSEYHEFVNLLPPREVIPMMKERINKTGSAQNVSCIQTMITSCSYYDSKDDVLQVLRYYYDQYKTEPVEVFFRVVQTLMQQFCIHELDKSCWRILMAFIQKIYVNGDLYSAKDYFYWGLFHGGLLFFIKESQKDPVDSETKQLLDKLIEIVLDCYLEHNLKVDLLPIHYCSSRFKRECLKKYLVTIPVLYPQNHEVWAKFGNKIALVSYLVKAIDDYDFKELCQQSMKNYKSGNTFGGKPMLRVRDYPWLTKFTFDLLKEGESYTDSEDIRKYDDLKQSLKRHDRHLYEDYVDGEIDCIRNVEVDIAMSLLKRDPSKILNKWKSYLNTCRENLKSIRRYVKYVKKFVKSIKWHQDLPIKFVEQCMLEIKDCGCIAVLAFLLDGKAFSKILQLHVPEDKKIDLTDDSTKSHYRFIPSLIKSMNHVNPPVSLEIMSDYCQGDNLHLACNTLSNVAQSIPVNKVITFANQLIADKSGSIRKLGIQLICRVSSYVDSGILASETNACIRAKIAKIIWKQFKQTPSSKTSQLMKICIDGLNGVDEGIFRMLSKVDGVDKDFVSHYLRDLLKKIDELEDHAKSQLVYSLMENLIDTTIVNYVSDDVLVDILKKQFFECDSRFMLTAYLFYDPNKFDKRLKALLDIVREKFKEYNKPDPKHPRRYPMNSQLRQFFGSITSYVLCADKTDMARKLITVSLELVSEKLKLYDEPLVFMSLYLVKNYMESPTPQEFGVKCSNTARRLVESLGSEMILNDIGKFMERMLCNGNVYPGNGLILRMAVIEGLSQIDGRIAALIGIKLLTSHDVDKYDARYDEFLKSWSSMKDPMVLAALNSFKN